ncbi:hypothetical protein CDL15_Pgr001739 [Punica granatum]|uniref:Uncharacterized protein n=1 Tax=Punica granatum TaxID=22663 RepID=A0A218XA98_PUNGR|nr:hypothetical protein CDL15_Pgr001739 [Punica granatum]
MSSRPQVLLGSLGPRPLVLLGSSTSRLPWVLGSLTSSPPIIVGSLTSGSAWILGSSASLSSWVLDLESPLGHCPLNLQLLGVALGEDAPMFKLEIERKALKWWRGRECLLMLDIYREIIRAHKVSKMYLMTWTVFNYLYDLWLYTVDIKINRRGLDSQPTLAGLNRLMKPGFVYQSKTPLGSGILSPQL